MDMVLRDPVTVEHISARIGPVVRHRHAGAAQSADAGPRRWQPATSEHAAVQRHQFLHRPVGNLPVPELTRTPGAAPTDAAQIASEAQIAISVDGPTLEAAASADALQCYEITDQAGLRRRLAWEGACS